MKLLVLAALIAAVSSGQLRNQNGSGQQMQGPWQVGKLYRYEVDTYTLARLQEGPDSGSAFKANFVIRVLSPGRLMAKLENPQHATVHQELLNNNQLPEGLNYQPIDKMDQPFEIAVEGGRITALTFPASLSLVHENVLKGLISSLQLDLSAYRPIRNSYYGYDEKSGQGLFKKMETDVTGDCETLYKVYPAVPEWRRELPNFAAGEKPMMITKSKNYGHCHHRVSYHFGVPEGSEWSGVAHKKHNEQLMRRATITRMLAAKQGPIYKTETISTVYVNPHLYGDQKAEVSSKVTLYLTSYEQDTEQQWPVVEDNRIVNSLLYSVSNKRVAINDDSSSTSASSESSSSESHEVISKKINSMEYVGNRVRRSAKTPKIIAINKVIVKRDEEGGSSSSSSSDSTSAFVNDDLPKSNEPAYAALYMSPQPRVDKKQSPASAYKLVQDMAQQLQNPNNMPKLDFLSKFNILVRILSSMSTEQLSFTTNTILSAKTAKDATVKEDMWMIYRDAVAQVGNMPAFQQIKSWIQTKKIQEEEAAEIVASLVTSIRYATKEVMMQFFEMAFNDDVKEQRYLNTTVLIGATKLINNAQVNNASAHSYYPTHMYGRLARQRDTFVVDDVIPRLSRHLRKAIEEKDSHKAQVYIQAIGNLGHRNIIQVFAPYIEGKIPVSNHLRTHMVKSFRVLAFEEDAYVRVVLFNILKNIAEPYETRVAAARNIFLTQPTIAMMQAMAQMTHDDPSMNVRAVLKSCILSSAELNNLRYLELKRKAQSVKWLMTKKEFGPQLSQKYMYDYVDNEFGTNTFFSYTGSENNLLPKSFKYAVKGKSNGYSNKNWISGSASDVQKLMELFQQQLDKIMKKEPKSESNHKYSAEKISEMLNIRKNPKNPLEAYLSINYMGQERFFTYEENDFKHLTDMVAQLTSSMAKGEEKHYTKLLNQAQVSVMFPVSSGMPFIFKYKEPMVVHFNYKTKGQLNLQSNENHEYNTNIENQIDLTYARNIEGSVGFMDTLADEHCHVGIVSKIQLQLPFKIQLQAKSKQIKIALEPLRPDQDNNLLHYSVWPYSTKQKKDSTSPVSHEPNTKIIHNSKKTVSVDTKVGQFSGCQFHIHGYSHSSDYQNLGKLLKSQNIFDNIPYLLYQKDVALTHFNLKQLVKQSQTKRVIFTFAYDTYYNLVKDVDNVQPLVAENMEDVAPNSIERRLKMAKRVSSGIQAARARVVDLSVTFDGQQNKELIMTAGLGDSPKDIKVQSALFLAKNTPQGNEQINAAFAVNKPEATVLNFLEAIKKDVKVKFVGDVKYGQSGNGYIKVQGFMDRTKQFTEELLKHPLANQCMKEVEKGNQYQHACHKMVIKAQAPDYLKASVNYKEVSPAFRNMTYKAFRFVDHIGFWFTDVNPMKTMPDGKLEIESQLYYLQNKMNLALSTRLGEVHFDNVPIPKSSASALSVYSPLKSYENVLNEYFGDQYQPFCTLDSNDVRTFSNRTYDYALTNNWHVALQNNHEQSSEEVVVLARRPTQKQMEIYISYKPKDGKDVEVLVKPSQENNGKPTLQVKTDAKKWLDGELTMYFDEKKLQPALQYYSHDNVLIINLQEDRLRVLYDGQTLVILPKGGRDYNTGLCGRMNGEPRDDYLTPTGIVDKSEYFGASFALKEADSDPKTIELQNQAKQVSYHKDYHYTVVLPTNKEWSEAVEDSASDEDVNNHNDDVYKTRSWLKTEDDCRVNEQIQFYEDYGQICITTSPLPACQPHCRSSGTKVQAAKVICHPKEDKQFREYREQIRKGENPVVPGVPKQQPKKFQVPKSCKL